MGIHMGIKCDKCAKVHFIGTSSLIQFRRSHEGIYRLNCPLPCMRTHEFQKHDMCPYRATDDVFGRGYAEDGEYEVVPSTWRTMQEHLAMSR